MKRTAMLGVGLLVMAAGCSGGGGGGYSSLDEAMAAYDCVEESNNQEVFFATDEIHCENGTVIARFETTEARDNYEDTAREFGMVPTETTEQFLIYEE